MSDILELSDILLGAEGEGGDAAARRGSPL